MPRSNTFRTYGSVTKTFHWLTALLILAVIPLGLLANDLAHQIRSPGFTGLQDDIARATLLFSMHKTVGVAIFLTSLVRILWALTQPKPGLLNAENRVEAMAAETVHWLLYGSLVMVPLSGWIHHAATPGFAPIWWPFGQTLPLVPQTERVSTIFAGMHHVLVLVLFAALFLHAAGALKHHVVDRDQTLRRMLPGSGAMPEPPARTHNMIPALIALAIWGATLAAGSALGAFEHTHDAVALTKPLPDTQPSAQEVEPGNWLVQDGTLELSIQQMGSKVAGRFDKWSATITFDERQTPGPVGSVDVLVHIGSLQLGSVTDQAMGPDFFDRERFPTARFAARIERTNSGYEAIGTLTIRDKSLPVTLPFDLDIDGNQARMHGSLTLERLEFDIGRSVTDPASLGRAVDIQVSLTAHRAG